MDSSLRWNDNRKMNTQEVLEDYGLDEKEAKVYLALLELGASTVQPVAQKAGIIRPNCYLVLDDLIKKGLVSYFEKNGRRRYVAEDPQVLSRVMRDRWTKVNELLPELRSLYNATPHKPKVRFYEGKQEVRELYEQLVNTKAYDNIYSPEFVAGMWGEYSPELGRRVAANGVKVRELIATTSGPVAYSKYFKKPLQEIRYWPGAKPLSSDLILFENKLAIVSYDTDIHTIVIEGSGIVDTVQAMFDFMWVASA